jgi:hypothetical protein
MKTLTRPSACSTSASTTDDLRPLLVDEWLMVEPTETETKEALDAFAAATAERSSPGRRRAATQSCGGTWFDAVASAMS